MIEPPPLLIISGIAYFAISIIEATLTRIALSHASTSTSTALPRGPAMPTLLTRMSSLPQASTDDRLTRCRNADVTLDDLRNTAFGVDQPFCLIRPLRNVIHQRHSRAVPRQNYRGRAAIADTFGTRTRAGDDGDLALEAVVSANCRHGFPPDLLA